MTRQYDRRITADFLHAAQPPTENVVERLLLYGYPTGESALAGAHLEALARFIVPYITTSSPVRVWVGGLASRRGSEELNSGLARQRALGVARALSETPAGGSQHTIHTASFGERHSLHTENSAYYRSVLVVVTRDTLAHPPRPRPEWEVDMAVRFRIRVMSEASMGVSIASLTEVVFELDYDDVHAPSRPMRYRLASAAASVSVPDGRDTPPAGPWNRFQSPVLASTSQFGGSIYWEQVLGWGSVVLTPTRFAPIRIRPFRGQQILAGIGLIQGPLTLSDSE